MSASLTLVCLQLKRESTVREVRERAAEVLAAVGSVKLRRIALFRARKWAVFAARLDDRDHADTEWVRAAEWLRIGRTLPASDPPSALSPWSSTLSQTTGESTVDDMEFTQLVAAMVADQAPRLFAIVLEYGEQIDAEIVAWGMALDDSAFVTSVDGRYQYALAEAENALKYVNSHAHATPRLVWASPSSG